MLMGFEAQDEMEVSVDSGAIVHCVEDLGNGWAKVALTTDGPHAGLVPSSYLVNLDALATTAGWEDHRGSGSDRGVASRLRSTMSTALRGTRRVRPVLPSISTLHK